MDCSLCTAQNETYRLVGGNDLAYCIIPTHALKPGHAMVLPRRHVGSLSDLIDTEARAFVRLADEMKNAVR
ncbi:MAG: HIT domain-containing protein [Nanoarchaeota archaeon]